MWARLEVIGSPAPEALFPAVARLLRAAIQGWSTSRRVRARGKFTYFGKPYRVFCTNLGRIKVYEGDTLLVNSGPFAVEWG